MKQTTFFLYSIFSATIFIGAFLLFQVQPIIGKYILPWFGGASFVWITSLLFFQTILLAGYFYAYIITKLHLRTQIYVHITVIAIGIIAIIVAFNIWRSPLTPDLSWKLPDTFPPSLQILQILFVSVGIPYFILSITSTLLQKWFSYLSPQKTPYTLYSISNAGSLLGIASYPFFIEPLFPIHNQATYWSFIFILYAGIFSISALITFRNGSKPKKEALNKGNLTIPRSSVWSWFSLPAISSVMLLSSTNQLTQTIAPIPFLWLLPLGIYLLSFILCFSSKHRYDAKYYSWTLLILVPVIISVFLTSSLLGMIFDLALYSCILFCCFMLCHGELYKRKPESKDLNAFYLLISFGSVVGGITVALIAPVLFVGMFWEFYFGLFLTSLIASFTIINNPKSFIYKWGTFSRKSASIFFTLVLSTFFLLTLLVIFGTQVSSSIGIWRNFYGTLRITKEIKGKETLLCLINGKIIHGCQYTSQKLRTKPTTYYGEKSGMGLAIKHLREKKQHLKIGVIGLGAGTTATYGQKGDYIKFYELNPLDVELAKEYFTYLKDSRANIDVALGDGRLTLAKELKENTLHQFDLLVIDAFSDDAIPLHLLTKEAFEIYRKHLDPSGIIAVHISTSYVNLKPPMIQLAKYFRMNHVVIQAKPDEASNASSRWALLSADKKLLNDPSLKKAKQDLSHEPQIPLWTDDYSNLFQILQY